MRWFRRRAEGKQPALTPDGRTERRRATPENMNRRKEIDELAVRLDEGEKRAVAMKLADASRRAHLLAQRMEVIKASARAIRRAPR